MLLTEAVNLVPLGAWHVALPIPFGQGFSPRPIVKKSFLSTVRGTNAGNCELAKLLSFALKLAAKDVSLRAGSFGIIMAEELLELGTL